MSNDEGTHKPARAGAPGRAQAPAEAPYEDPVDQFARKDDLSVDDRVTVVAQLMATGRWSPSKAMWLQQLWALSAESIKDYATQAKRALRLAQGVGGLKVTQRKVSAQFQAAYELAMAKGDPKAAVAAAKGLADVHGLVVKKIATTDQQGHALPPAQQALVQLFMLPGVLPFVATKQRLPTEAELAALIETTGEPIPQDK